MKSRYFLIVILLSLGLCAGFLQEYLKINVNYILETGRQIPGFFSMDEEKKKAWIEYKKKNAPNDFYHKPETITALYSLKEQTLEQIKWINTIAFIGVFLFLNVSLVRLITGNNQLARWMLYLYGAFFILALIVFLLGKLTGKLENTYMLSREIVGGLQSLIPLMIMLPAIWVAEKMNKKTDSQ